MGRIASEAASVLLGKKTIPFKKNVVADIEVEVINASKVKITGKKLDQKNYVRYSGHPGGLKSEKMKVLADRKGFSEVIKNAISGMLPKNKLRTPRLLRLKITE